MKLSPARDGPSPQELDAATFGGYRGPLNENIKVEEVGTSMDDTLANLAILMHLMDREDRGPLLPRAAESEDGATYETSVSDVEAWMHKMDEAGSDDEPPDPPPSAPDSALPWWLRDDDEEGDRPEGRIAA